MDICKASKKLSELELQINFDNFIIDILWFRVMMLEGEWKINRHTHSSFEFHFVASGSSAVKLDDKEFIAKEGEFYITAPGVYHEQSSEGDNYIEYSLNCDLKKISDNFSETSILFTILNSVQPFPVKDYYKAMGYFELALKEAYEQKVGFYNNIKSLATIIITMAVRALNQDDIIFYEYDVPKREKEEDYRFILIEKFINDNIKSDIFVEDIANYMHLSSKQIYRIIKRKTGKSTKEFINYIKLQKAKEMLKNTIEPVKEIANKLGFSSEYYFNQFFKREEGFPPGIFRNNIKNV